MEATPETKNPKPLEAYDLICFPIRYLGGVSRVLHVGFCSNHQLDFLPAATSLNFMHCKNEPNGLTSAATPFFGTKPSMEAIGSLYRSRCKWQTHITLKKYQLLDTTFTNQCHCSSV